MYCARCGGELAANTSFCGTCGAAVSHGATPPISTKRPGIITLLGVLQLIGAAIELLIAVALIATAFGSDASQSVPAVFVALLMGVAGGAQLLCGIGLLSLKSYGRTLQLVFAWIGLIAFPIGTIISVLILVYMNKPGIKALFSGKALSEFSNEELAHIAAVNQGSWAVVVVVVALGAVLLVGMIGIVAAIAVPGLLRARMSGNEASAIGALRAINSAEAAYASSCASGGYAVTLDDLARPEGGSGQGFISSDLSTNGVTKNGYRITLEKEAGATDVGTAAATCNNARNPPESAYFASAEPVTPGTTGTRYFATDTRGTIFTSDTPIANPIAPGVMPLQ